MVAVLSATEHDFYAMPLPFAVFSWHMLGVKCVVFIPEGDNPKIELTKKYCPSASFFTFKCEEKRIPTYSQVSRLFAAAIPIIDEYDDLITSDSDMAVFDGLMELVNSMECMQVIGHDLTSSDQVPMCYLRMRKSRWKEVFNITKTYQEHVAELIDPIEGLNIRGEQWCYDQWYAKKKLAESDHSFEIDYVKRSNGITSFATRRADRDGWHFDPYNLVDAHLPRPLTDRANFQKVLDLFTIKYPFSDLSWMERFRDEYMAL